jgi:hypothetical protein
MSLVNLTNVLAPGDKPKVHEQTGPGTYLSPAGAHHIRVHVTAGTVVINDGEGSTYTVGLGETRQWDAKDGQGFPFGAIIVDASGGGTAQIAVTAW